MGSSARSSLVKACRSCRQQALPVSAGHKSNVRTYFSLTCPKGQVPFGRYQTEEFVSAGAFLDRLPIEGEGCLILDHQMPQMTSMELLQDQWPNRKKLDIAERTVKAHRAKVMEKLEVEMLADLVRQTMAAGMDVPD